MTDKYLTMRLIPYAWLLIIGAAIALRGSECYAMPTPSPDSLGWHEAILFIGSLNNDCAVDTAIGVRSDDGNYTLDRIVWGGWDGLPSPPGATGCLHKPKVHVTHFVYPSWGSLAGATAFLTMNQDTVTDVLLFYFGDIGTPGSPHDTSRISALMGSNALDSAATVELAILPPTQIMPFVSRDLHTGGELAEPAIRDLTETTSYILVTPFTFPGPPPPPRPESAEVESNWDLNLAPNPTTGELHVRAASVPPGRYHIEVVDAAGKLALGQDLDVEVAQELTRLLDMSRLPNGYYLIRLRNDAGETSVHPIVVTR